MLISHRLLILFQYSWLVLFSKCMKIPKIAFLPFLTLLSFLYNLGGIGIKIVGTCHSIGQNKTPKSRNLIFREVNSVGS